MKIYLKKKKKKFSCVARFLSYQCFEWTLAAAAAVGVVVEIVGFDMQLQYNDR